MKPRARCDTGHVQAVRKSDALKSQKTEKPLMRMKIVIQNTP